jgi:hypothetical protein
METHSFVVAAGGSGAKVVESLVHLCAAGLGPDSLDILLLDVDENNGNMKRCRETLALYGQLASKAWKVKVAPRDATAFVHELDLFHTKIRVHSFQKQIELVARTGLQLLLLREEGAYAPLDLLFDESEQSSRCEKGFMARPNLGSLILGKHLGDALKQKGTEACAFKEQFQDALSKNQPLSLVVTGSVFGGTGASLFPVACQCIKSSLGSNDTSWKKVAATAVFLLPHFHPKNKQGSLVDASRFHADSISTLRHYADSQALDDYSLVYLVGSDDSKRNILEHEDGAGEQCNPCHLEEFVAACAILDASAHAAAPASADSSPKVKILNTSSGTTVDWQSLPLPASQDSAGRMALLAHLCTFILLRQTNGPLSAGLLHFINVHGWELESMPIYSRVLGKWAEAKLSGRYLKADKKKKISGWEQLKDPQKTGAASVPHLMPVIAEYAWRFLLWARHSTLETMEGHALVDYGGDRDYAAVWETMCDLTEDEIRPLNGTEDEDNALLRLCRGAACAIQKLATSHANLDRMVLRESKDHPVFPGSVSTAQNAGFSLPVTDQTLKDMGPLHSLRTGIYVDYTRTASKS